MKENKICKGINKAYGFEDACGKLVTARSRRYGLCVECFKKWCYSTEKGGEFISNLVIKVRSDREKQNEELRKEENRRNEKKSLEALKKSLKTICHKYIRLRDKDKPCISCGFPLGEDYDAGHCYKAELFSNLKYDENNIHGQCIKCNRREEGNLSGYFANIENRIGKVEFANLQLKAKTYKKHSFKWCREDLENKIEYYKKKYKSLKDS
jgi:hypothetical protein